MESSNIRFLQGGIWSRWWHLGLIKWAPERCSLNIETVLWEMWSVKIARRHLLWKPSEAFPDHTSGRSTSRKGWPALIWESSWRKYSISRDFPKKSNGTANKNFIHHMGRGGLMQTLSMLLRRSGVWWLGWGARERITWSSGVQWIQRAGICLSSNPNHTA